MAMAGFVFNTVHNIQPEVPRRTSWQCTRRCGSSATTSSKACSNFGETDNYGTDKSIIEELEDNCGEGQRAHFPEDLACYSYDGTFVESLLVQWVNPALTEEVASVLKLATREDIPITAVGWAVVLLRHPFPSKAALSLASRA